MAGNRAHCVTGRQRMLKALACCLASLLLVQCPVTGWAQAPTTITSSGLNTTVVPPAGTPATTAIRGGTLSPDHTNLFHSFGEFSVAHNDIASFQNLNAEGTAPLVGTASSVANIIGRVTGANPSSIFGTINSQGGFPNANLFLINPRGIVFGPGATLQVGGAVHFSTADYLRMGTGNEFFYADLARSSTLTSAPVTAFGFLGANPVGTQAIELRDSAHLTVAPDQNLSLVGRDTRRGGEPVPGIRMTQGSVTSPGGRISLVSVGTPLDPTAGGEVRAFDSSPAAASSGHGFTSLGHILMTDNSSLSVSNMSGPAVGHIVIRGGQLTLEGSRFLARTTDGNTIPGGIDIHVAGAMSLRAGSSIDSQVVGHAGIPGGHIFIQAGSLAVTEGSQITAVNESGHSSAVGGNIDITADTVTVSGAIDGGGNTVQSGLFSGTTRTSSGAGGRIRVTSDVLSILDGAAIDTSTFSDAQAGGIELTAARLLVSDVNTANGITSPASTISSRATWDRQADNPNQEQQHSGSGGNILIRAASLELRDGGQLNASTETAGNAGTITVVADTIIIAGGAGVNRSGISTETSLSGSGRGTGGTVNLTAATLLDLSDGAVLALDTRGAGAAGTLNVQAGAISLSGGSQITSGTISDGAAGNLSLTSGSLMMHGSTISTRTFGSGNAGTIAISADTVTLNGSTARIDSSTNTVAAQAGSGGSIIVTAGNTLAVNGGIITTSSSGAGHAGTIQASGSHIGLTGGGEILSSTTTTGAGGTVTVTATGPAGSVLINGGAIKASTTGSGQAGNVVVGGDRVTVFGGASTIETNTAGAGNAGSIEVQAGQLILADGGAISSASVGPSAGHAGSVTLSAIRRFESTGGHVTTSADHGLGGDITLRSDEIHLNGGATIAADTRGPLDAGDILLAAENRIMIQDSSVTTSASQASGGNITLLAPDLVRLRNGRIISSVQGGPGTSGGDITIDPQAVLLQHNSQILAQAFQGNGGNISLIAGVLIVEPGSLIDATSQLGLSGQVSVQAPVQSLASVVMPLPQSFINSANLYGQRCAARKGGQFSSFVQGGRDGLPPEPGDMIQSPLPSRLTIPPPSHSDGSAPAALMAHRLGFNDGFLPESSWRVFTSGCRS
jgi:filamentous hemagglutinin family protein